MKTAVTAAELDIPSLRKAFPVLHQTVNGHPLVYFDNAATTQKPSAVINALVDYYRGYNANIHRGIHTLAEKATRAFEESRVAAQKFLGAREKEEIIFVRGVTEAINLVAQSLGSILLQPGDEILLSGMEHHSNIVPWQLVAELRGALIKVIPVTESGELDMAAFERSLSVKTKIVSVNHASNSLGTINPIETIIQKAHAVGAKVLIDGAQAAAHLEIDVQKLDCDFYCISGHKMYGPTGVGVLYGKRALLEQMPPYQGGGEMIKEVTFEKTTYNDIPYKFEAGTPNIADVIALKGAFDFINGLGKEAIRAHENKLLQYAVTRLTSVKGIRLIGTARDKVSVQSFLLEGIHPFDVGQLLDARGIAVRTGHHCTQPLMDRFGIDGTVRASFAVYNTEAEIDRLLEGLTRINSLHR
ncbi:MAG: cysteine desulfurase [Cyclobacteriaceae bacterium]|nr:cysteine desulfurase [Cyclobacteriaceae bacterium]